MRATGLVAGFLTVLAILFVGLAAPAAAEDDGRIVVAQLFRDDTPFLLRLFGGGRRAEPAPPRNGPKVMRVPRNGQLPGFEDGSQDRPGGPKRIRPKKPAVVANPKNADAKRVLVVGDRMADYLARGLDVAFADTPTLRIENAAAAGTGLADPTRKDWTALVEARFAAENPPDAVVIIFGNDDRVPIMVDGIETAFRLPGWETVYEARIRALIAAARSRQGPVFWTGVVPMADLDLTTDMAYLDELYRRVAGEAGARYVDVWNAFSDETGSFVASGPDIGGQVRQLRLKDGIGFTKSGSRKLAFYVEQELRSWLANGGPGVSLPQQTAEGGLVVSLNDPEVGPEEDLAPSAPGTAPKEGTPLYDLVVLGKPLQPKVGRVDDLAAQ